ncbi:hypothetical protein Pmani_009342 [Petrolisthes manimaculis]|uniref:Uncharacterized protein n=1 Tax=Petrolisthes manimaculis TaxID=1843537 RepID=A0AAE1Q3R7_9EUCA|nr:hypothetical protein Pmani_009342 [Petrolisthes manimaculis]
MRAGTRKDEVMDEEEEAMEVRGWGEEVEMEFNWKDVEENSGGRGYCDINPASLANSGLVPFSTEVVGRTPVPALTRVPGFGSSSRPHTPTGSQVENDSHDPLGQSLKNQGLSKEVAEFLLRSWKHSTKLQYQNKKVGVGLSQQGN